MTNITSHPTYTETRRTVAQAREAIIKRQAARIERLVAALRETRTLLMQNKNPLHCIEEALVPIDAAINDQQTKDKP